MNTIVSKGDYARRKHRSPACITKWIKGGKISPAAMIGSGNAAKIWVERADADLAESLDPSQQLTQRAPVLPAGELAASCLLGPMNETPPPRDSDTAAGADLHNRKTILSEREQDLARRAKADADRSEYDAEQARRKLALDEGKYILAADVARTWARELAKLMSEIETFMGATLARELAARHGLEWKPLTVEMREAFRRFRGGISEQARDRRATIEAAADDGESAATIVGY